MGETCIKELLFVGYAACYQHDGNVMVLGALEDTKGEFPHEGLAVSRAFAGNYEIGILQQVVEMDSV